MSERADKHAAAKRDEDLGYLSTYISTEAGATGQSNADVLGRLVTDAHARLSDLALVMDRIANSLEKVVAPKLHTLQQLPEEVAELRETLPLYAALRDRIAIVEKDLQTSICERLPDGTTRTLG